MIIKAIRHTKYYPFVPYAKESKYNTPDWSIEHMAKVIEKYFRSTELAKHFNDRAWKHFIKFKHRPKGWFIETLIYIENETQTDLFVTDSPDLTT